MLVPGQYDKSGAASVNAIGLNRDQWSCIRRRDRKGYFGACWASVGGYANSGSTSHVPAASPPEPMRRPMQGTSCW